MSTYDKEDILNKENKVYVVSFIFLIISMMVYRMGATVVDIDIWHQMALARETFRLGYIPYNDSFSYVETIYPSVHHEWGAGLIAYIATSFFGYDAIVLLRYILVFLSILLIFIGLKKNNINLHITLFLAPLSIYLFAYGTLAVRAQMYSFLCTCLLMIFLDSDKKGGRWWIIPWLIVYILWLNVHGGFLVGLGLTLIYCIEQFIRKRPSKHIAAVVFLMTIVIVINPYGLQYYPYLINAIIMKRPNITEWKTLFSAELAQICLFAIAIFILLYVIKKCKFYKLNGLLLILSTAIVSMKAQRMLPFFALVWFYYVPGWIEKTPLGTHIISLFKNKKKHLLVISIVGTVIFSLKIVQITPWNVQILNQVNPKLGHHIIYPVDAVEYLRSNNFNGNVLVPFDWGAYVIWELYPNVKVSLDSRYEATYPIKVVNDQYNLFMGAANWKQLLHKYRSNIILIHRRLPLSRLIKGYNEWSLIYGDNNWEIFSNKSVNFP